MDLARFGGLAVPEVLKTRRKLKPTHVERSIFGDGDGSDIAVVDSEFGRLGALCCAEHIQPLTKYAMFSQHEQLHIAAWPSFSVYEGAAYLLGPEVNTAASQQYAVEGQVFVLAPTGLIGQAAHDLFADTETKRDLPKLGGGHARIYGSDGRSVATPLAPTEEGILYADINYAEILGAKNAYDPVGHYSRPDVLHLMFKRGDALQRERTAAGLVRFPSYRKGGELQAAALSERFRHERLAAAFTSDLLRTRTTTAAALTGHPHLSPTQMHELREWNFRSWEGKPNASLWGPVFRDHGYTYTPASPDWPRMTADEFDSVIDSVPRHDPRGRAETSQQVRDRMTQGLDVVMAAAEQAAGSEAGDVLVVTHGAVLGTLLRRVAPDYLLPAGFPNCGIITVSWHEGDVAVGETDNSCTLRELA